MKERKLRKIISFVLTLIFAIQLVPVQALAQETDPAAKTGERFVDSRLSDSDSSISVDAAADLEPAAVVCEIIENRSEFQKEFLMDNGLRLAVIYPNAVHYQEDGEWREIDNTLRPVAVSGGNLTAGEMTAVSGTGTASYRNTAGMWDVTLPANLNANSAVQVEKDGYTLSFRFAGEVNSNTVIMRVEEDVSETLGETSGEVLGSEAASGELNAEESVSAETAVDSANITETGETEVSVTAPVAEVREPTDIGQENSAANESEAVSAETDSGETPEEESESTEIAVEEPIADASAGETVAYELSVAQATASNGVIMSIPQDSPETQWEYPEARVDTLSSAITYSNVYTNTDIRYDLTSNKLKESVIINQPSATLTGYEYVLTAPNMVLELQEDNSIHAYAADAEEGDEPIFYLPAPYLLDQEDACSTNVGVTLRATGNSQYTLSYALPRQWLLDEARVYPVILDPVVQPVSNTATIRDKTVRKRGTPASHYAENLRVGFWEDYGAERIFIRFQNIPELSSADVVVKAAVSMYKIKDWPVSFDVQVHQLDPEDSTSVTWDSSTITWDTMPELIDSVEDVQTVSAEGWYTWDITNIAQRWYDADKNMGLAFRGSDTWEGGDPGDYTQVSSSDVSNSNLAPVLQILYLNNAGLEDYWDYTTHSAGRAGTGYVSKFTGNLVWVHDVLSFPGTRMPVSIKLIYNANDKDNNDPGCGYGWRTNYHQMVYPWDSDDDYYVWIDQDGTRKYFKYDASLDKYVNEIDPTLTLTDIGLGVTKYCITDKSGNKSYFDENGRLRSIQNNQQNLSTITIFYKNSEQLIDTITDGAGRVYQFEYHSSDFLSAIKLKGETEADDILCLECSYTHTDLAWFYHRPYDVEIHGNSTKPNFQVFEYEGTDTHLLTAVNDVSGYRIEYGYNNTNAGLPNRVNSITEKDGGTTGGSLSIIYGHNQTIFTDHNKNQEIVQFNNYGSTTSVQDGQGRAQFYRYAAGDTLLASSIHSAPRGATQMTVSSKLQNTVVNLARNGSFEWNSNYWTTDINDPTVGSHGVSGEEAYLGRNSMKVTLVEDGSTYIVRSTDAACPVEPGKAYTLSAYVKTTNMDDSGAGASISLQSTSTGNTLAQSETKIVNSDWTRVETTYVHPSTAATDSVFIVLRNKSVGTAYFDCVQLEQTIAASRYNIVENGDFRYSGTTAKSAFGWTDNGDGGNSDGRVVDEDGSAAPQLDASVHTFLGEVDKQKAIYQDIYISGSKGDVFTVAAWAKGESIPLSGLPRQFAISVEFYDADDEAINIYRNPFNPDCGNYWQYVANRVVAPEDYSKVRVYLLYCKNLNTVSFDGIQLFKEEFGHSYVYDDNGNVVSVTDLQNQKTGYEYTNNHLTAITMGTGDDKKVIAEYEYDNYNNVKKTISATGVTTTFTYDAYGNNTKVSVGYTNGSKMYSLAASATYTSDKNQLATVKDALGNTTTYNYDLRTGQLLSVQAPGETAATATTYTYDDLYRTVGVSKTNGTATTAITYTYSTDLLDSITSASGTEYNFAYGAFDLVQSVSIGNGDSSRTLITHQYGDNDNNSENDNANRYLIRSTYGNGDYIAYTYDDLGRGIAKTYEDGDTVTYTYNSDGNLGRMTASATGRTTKYLYDFQGRVMGYDETGTNYSNAVRVEYDDKNNLSSQTHTLNGESYTTSYTYDKDNRIKSSVFGDTSAEYTYDNLSRMTKVEGKDGDSAVVTTNIGYKETEKASLFNITMVTASTQIATWENETPAGTTSFAYTYNSRGNIRSISDGTNTTRYTYDSLDQMIREDNQAAGKTWRYTYDNGGNILSKTEHAYTTGTVGTALDTVTYTYGDSQWKDLLTAYDGQTITTDAIGNVTNDGTRTYTWEHGRQLVGVSGNGVSVTYQYDADGRRIAKNVTNTATAFHYAGDQLAVMVTGNDVLEFSYDVLGPATLTYNDGTYYYLRNAQGDITGIIDADGETVATYTYDAWGNHIVTDDTVSSYLGDLNPFRYRGYFYDEETGLYYLNSRYYNPQWGRFICTDNFLSTVGGELRGNNSFAYCFNNPIVFVDRFGQFPFALVALGILVIAGAIYGYTYDGELGSGTEKIDPVTNQKPLLPNETEKYTPQTKPNLPPGVTEDMISDFSNSAITPQTEPNTPTVGIKLKNTLIGASLGLLAGGGVLAVVGAGAALIAGNAFVSIGVLGGTAAQTFAIGAIAIDIFAITVAPIYGIEMEPIEAKP